MNFKLFILVIPLIITSCNRDDYHYPQNTHVSSNQGEPNDPLVFYFPDTIKTEKKTIAITLDTFKLKWYSGDLFCANEPILYNYYLGHDIYRLLYLRAFHNPIIISLNKDNDRIWLTTKELSDEADFNDTGIHNNHLKDSHKITTEIIVNKTRKLTHYDWLNFELLLDSCEYWNSEPTNSRIGLDGSEWILEAHLSNKYWFVDRWCPDGYFRKASLFLINKSELDEIIY
jgi:hypothetical protein